MKVLILVICGLASTSSVYLGYSPWAHHFPLIGPGGHPVDTPEVQHAKAAHFAAHAAARSGQHFVPIHHLSHYGVAPISHNGLPLDTPEVAAAKIQHHHDYAVAAQRNGVAAPFHQGYALGHTAGLPVDTPEVQLAKAAHFAAHAEAASRAHGYHHYRKRRAIYPYAHHIPVIGPHGVPQETPEVQAAKAHHFAAHAQAASRASPYHYGYTAGIPQDAPDVALAKSHHFAAHAEAASRVGAHSPITAPWRYVPHAVIGPDGHPVETPEVQHAKAAHFAAHAAVRGGHHHHYY